MNFINIDKNLTSYFINRLKQVFLYITDECNLNCIHCLYKPDIHFHFINKNIKFQTAVNLLRVFKMWGASKLTLIGGEPTLYDIENRNVNLIELLDIAKKIGYEYVRLDTNGIEIEKLLKIDRFKKNLDELAFSLDGPNPEINDAIRGKNSFIQCVSNIKKAMKLGYNVSVTSCIHKKFIINGKNSIKLNSITSFIDLITSMGIKQLNFHPIFKMGVPRDLWINNTTIAPQDWIIVEREIQKKISEKANISVRIPKRFILKGEFDKNPLYYGYCPVKLGERILVHPNGMLRICALLIGSPYGIGKFDDNNLFWDYSQTNEILNHDLKIDTPCQNQKFANDELLPLCISHKPKQKEFIWETKLKWDDV